MFHSEPIVTKSPQQLQYPAVGIDLGTTYSSIAFLNSAGEPETIPNAEGELQIPSVVQIEGEREIVGTKAERNMVICSDRVIRESKPYMGDLHKKWSIDKRIFTPVDVATMILRSLLDSARRRIGPFDHATITVPSMFNRLQKQDTIAAAKRAGLSRVDIVVEPVAASLCYIMGEDGLLFSHLADRQRILVCDLGGGTYDLALIDYSNREIQVVAYGGDIHLGGRHWTECLISHLADRFEKEFGVNPCDHPESRQYLARVAERAKRALSTQDIVEIPCHYPGNRTKYTVRRGDFERLTQALATRASDLPQQLLRENKLGWAHVDVLLTVGGASQMPMIQAGLQKFSGRTPNRSLSPDQSVVHGAALYSGLLQSHDELARSIHRHATTLSQPVKPRPATTARDVGILIRDASSQELLPHYLIRADSPLPAIATQTFETVKDNQRQVRLKIVEAGNEPGTHGLLGECLIDQLVPNLPSGARIEVTFYCDEDAELRVSGREQASGRQAVVSFSRETADGLHPEISSNLVVQRKHGHLVFISYSTVDSAEALLVCKMLEDAGIRCWIAPRDIPPGRDWIKTLTEAISSSSVFVLITSEHAIESREVLAEIKLASQEGIPMIPYRIRNVPLSKSFEYLLGLTQWMDAWTPPREVHAPKLITAVNSLLQRSCSE